MIRGLYTAASGMLYETKRQTNISQNLSNVETNGFKQTLLLAAAQEEGTVMNQNRTNEVGSLTMKVGIDESYLDFSQGVLKTTNLPHDFAITGEGFFVLDGPNNERLYTRDGNFGVDDQGRLVSQEGYPVLMAGGGYATVNDAVVSSDDQGRLRVENREYQLQLVNLPDLAGIKQMGNNTYTYAGETVNAEVGSYTITQGMLEGSNIDATEEMINLINSTRSLQMNSKVLQAFDQILGQAVNEIGKL